MYSFDKIKLLSSKVVDSIFKGEKSEELEKSDVLTDEDKKDVLFNILDKNKRQERLEFTSKLNKRKAWENFIENTNQKIETKPKSKVKQMYWYYVVAASIVILLGITFFFNKDNSLQLDNQPIIVDNNIEVGTDKATLTLDDGEKIVLVKGTTFQTPNANSNGENIAYLPTGQAGNAGDNPTTEIAYNYLTIPRGGQFNITLADSTIVWLNSETQLKYPVVFTKGQPRQVELVYGEAYFDVSPSTNHNGATFKIYNNHQEIEVLGTEFNVKAYKDDPFIYTTLVEGSVAVSVNDGSIKKLIPGEQSTLNIQNNSISITNVNIQDAVSWKDGVFSFRGKPLKDLMKVLARWYDMNVVFKNEAHKDIKFKGILRKHQSIEEVMSIIKSTSINNYTIDNKTITIK